MPKLQRAQVLAATREFFRQRHRLYIVQEHDTWWVIRETKDGPETWAVHPAVGPGTVNGCSFEPC